MFPLTSWPPRASSSSTISPDVPKSSHSTRPAWPGSHVGEDCNSFVPNRWGYLPALHRYSLPNRRHRPLGRKSSTNSPYPGWDTCHLLGGSGVGAIYVAHFWWSAHRYAHDSSFLSASMHTRRHSRVDQSGPGMRRPIHESGEAERAYSGGVRERYPIGRKTEMVGRLSEFRSPHRLLFESLTFTTTQGLGHRKNFDPVQLLSRRSLQATRRSLCWFHIERKWNRAESADRVRLTPLSHLRSKKNWLQDHYNDFFLHAARVQEPRGGSSCRGSWQRSHGWIAQPVRRFGRDGSGVITSATLFVGLVLGVLRNSGDFGPSNKIRSQTDTKAPPCVKEKRHPSFSGVRRRGRRNVHGSSQSDNPLQLSTRPCPRKLLRCWTPRPDVLFPPKSISARSHLRKRLLLRSRLRGDDTRQSWTGSPLVPALDGRGCRSLISVRHCSRVEESPGLPRDSNEDAEDGFELPLTFEYQSQKTPRSPTWTNSLLGPQYGGRRTAGSPDPDPITRVGNSRRQLEGRSTGQGKSDGKPPFLPGSEGEQPEASPSKWANRRKPPRANVALAEVEEYNLRRTPKRIWRWTLACPLGAQILNEARSCLLL